MTEAKFESLKEENERLKELLCQTEAVQDKTALILKSQTITELSKQKSELQSELLKAKEGLKTVMQCCDGNNQAHEEVYYVARIVLESLQSAPVEQTKKTEEIERAYNSGDFENRSDPPQKLSSDYYLNTYQ